MVRVVERSSDVSELVYCLRVVERLEASLSVRRLHVLCGARHRHLQVDRNALEPNV